MGLGYRSFQPEDLAKVVAALKIEFGLLKPYLSRTLRPGRE